MTTYKFETRNGFNHYASDGRLHLLKAKGELSINIEECSITTNTDRAAQLAADIVAQANAAWAAPSDNDPRATDAQIAAIRSLAPRARIMRLDWIDMDNLTKSQASRVIECASDIAANGY